MVNALREAQRVLTPSDVLIDVRPVTAPISCGSSNCQSGGLGEYGQLISYSAPEDVAAADAAVQHAVSREWLVFETSLPFNAKRHTLWAHRGQFSLEVSPDNIRYNTWFRTVTPRGDEPKNVVRETTPVLRRQFNRNPSGCDPPAEKLLEVRLGSDFRPDAQYTSSHPQRTTRVYPTAPQQPSVGPLAAAYSS